MPSPMSKPPMAWAHSPQELRAAQAGSSSAHTNLLHQYTRSRAHLPSSRVAKSQNASHFPPENLGL